MGPAFSYVRAFLMAASALNLWRAGVTAFIGGAGGEPRHHADHEGGEALPGERP